MAKKKIQHKNFEEDKGKFIMSGLTIVMMATLVIYFIGAMIRKDYLVSFSIDLIVAAIALAMLLRNLVIKYKILKNYGSVNDFALLDFFSILLCIMIKIAFKIPFDLSLPILVMSYFISKKKFENNR